MQEKIQNLQRKVLVLTLKQVEKMLQNQAEQKIAQQKAPTVQKALRAN